MLNYERYALNQYACTINSYDYTKNVNFPSIPGDWDMPATVFGSEWAFF